ncbi:hypothetical protein [Cellulomonas sp. Y8]|uniref:hypothetical protein n=1 Tax=Cellulomonas sp. Y8 TaxID=2591145 RepID=UPI003D747222
MSPRRRRVRPGPGGWAAPEREPAPAGRVLDARLHLLDRQLLDRDRVPLTTVDDLEVRGLDGDPGPTGADTAVITALLTGPVLATRLFGGRPPSDRWARIPWRDVADVGTALRLGVGGDGLDATWVERWLRDHVVARIPGGRHDPE